MDWQKIEQKAAAFERRHNSPYIKRVDDRLLKFDNAIKGGDRECIWNSMQCAFTMLTPYLEGKQYYLKKKIDGLKDISNDVEFVTKAKKIYFTLCDFKIDNLERTTTTKHFVWK